MNILYLTDNREKYTQGYYYEDWLEAFKKRFRNMTVFGPGHNTKRSEIPSEVDLVVYGHSFIDVYISKRFRIFDKRFDGLNKNDISSLKHIPSILFSKNEYKFMSERIEFMKEIDRCLFVVHCKQSLDKYKDIYNKIFWIPYGINTERFYEKNITRTIDIAMRGNKHDSYIGCLRTDVADRISKNLSFLNLDVKLSIKGEDFLFGNEYFDWLNLSKFVANTKSAMDIVNPKFAEIIACGAIPLCPVDVYEGLLKKNKHYIDIDEALRIRSVGEFESFYNEKKEKTKFGMKKYIENFNYDNLLNILLKKFDNYIDTDGASDCF
jgi:hypothetical protein